MRYLRLFAGGVVMLVVGLAATAQEAGLWHASSQTARSITGDVGLSVDRITINFLVFTIAKIRALEAPEVDAAFSPEPGIAGSANLYRLRVPAAQKLLHKNTLCGTDDTTWMATWVTGRDLEITFFSGEKPPVFEAVAISNSTNVCGTYSYTR